MTCHPLPTANRDNHSYLVRVCNRSPGSNWEILAAGMVTGKVKGNYFTNDPIYVNFQLTKRKSELVKKVRKVKGEKKVQFKYSTDQNGRLTVKKNGETNWITIRNEEDIIKMFGNN